MRKRFNYIILLCIVLFSCRQEKKGPVLFELLESERTGLDFQNNITSTDSFNLFRYMYFYNGAGIGAGDFNNDGLIDLFFASNQSDNSLYLNKGGLQFRNVTKESGIPNNGGWSTGVSVVDINNDGLLDIYISHVGKYEILNSHNQFLICTGIDKDGIPHYADEAKKLGLDFSGFGTQSAFFDFDLDGDLDVFLLNHSVHHTGNFRERSVFMGTFHPTSGSRFYRNDGSSFTDITETCGINSTAIGYGLGIAVSDINLDGYPDIYVGNDFHENDYLYMNQKNGHFKDLSGTALMHTSKYTMGVDVADVSNDGLPEVVSVDMLPHDPGMLKRAPGEDSYDIFNMRINYGYSYQYSRNALQYNRNNGHFSETALYSGMAATDWSWAPLWMDFDNDGKKDLFISNGIPRRLNDIDYINYVSDQSIQQQIIENKINEKDKALIDKFPRIKIPNRFFRNSGNMLFSDIHKEIGNEKNTFSNGAIYADLDNDGDLDIVVNNIDENAMLYQNKSNDNKHQQYLQLKLKGQEKNINALGAKVIVFAGKESRTYEKFPVRGFLSSMEIPVHMGLENTKPDSVIIVWPDNSYQKLHLNGQKNMRINYQKGLPVFDYAVITARGDKDAGEFSDMAKDIGLQYVHKENSFPEFDREPLIPHMLSTEGPALAIADINKDGLDDVFIGSSKGYKSVVFLRAVDGKFVRTIQPGLDNDSSYEDVDACWADINQDKLPDLIVASGGNEYYGKDSHLTPRVYINNNGELVKKPDAFDSVYATSSCVAPYDFNGDGYTDLFVGGRAVPWDYGTIPDSYLLQNDGTGKFTDVTAKYSDVLKKAGLVTSALWFDMDKDGKKDLLISSEWGTIDVYLNKESRFEKKILCDKKGWWNTVLPFDADGDGDIDLIAGNLGLNSRLQASDKEPVRLYYGDFDNNGKKEQLLTYYVEGKEIPFAGKSEMEKQIPDIKKQFLYAKDFAKASLTDIFERNKLENSQLLSANYFAHCLLINTGNLGFDCKPLPWETQLTTIRDAMIIDGNRDNFPDVMAMGNYYQNNVEMGRADAGYGSLLINDGKGRFVHEGLKGVVVKGEARHVKKITINGKEACVIVRNNDSTIVLSTQGHKSW